MNINHIISFPEDFALHSNLITQGKSDWIPKHSKALPKNQKPCTTQYIGCNVIPTLLNHEDSCNKIPCLFSIFVFTKVYNLKSISLFVDNLNMTFIHISLVWALLLPTKPLFASYTLSLSELTTKWLHVYILVATSKQLKLHRRQCLQVYLTFLPSFPALLR